MTDDGSGHGGQLYSIYTTSKLVKSRPGGEDDLVGIYKSAISVQSTPVSS